MGYEYKDFHLIFDKLYLNMSNREEIDLALAIQLQAQFEEELRVRLIKENDLKIKSLQVTGFKWSAKFKDLPEPEQEKFSVSLVDPSWELLDPNPNVHELFLTFNHQFFWERLSGIEVKWSPRMTLCAGVCSYERRGLCSVRLSTPLLKLRPRKDLVETLLHEMIHAYLFVTDNNTDHDGHGPQFHTHMFRINKIAQTNISVYHSFHDEVAVYRQHIWQCNGPCRRKSPYYGLVKRSMNRAPSVKDRWWSNHEQTCGGSYTKIKEPDGYGNKKTKLNSSQVSPSSSSSIDIRSYFDSKDVQSKVDQRHNKTKVGTYNNKANSSINGFKSTGANGTIGQVNISNASNSNVNGFAKSGNPQGNKFKRNKPKDAMGTASSGRSKTMGTASSGGSKTMGTASSGGSKTMASTSSGGSRTMVVKRKTPEDDSRSAKVVNTNFTPFAGAGHTLSSSSNPSSGKSRLLSFNNNFGQGGRSTQVVKPKTTESPTTECSDQPVSKHKIETCPMCHSSVASNDFEHHIEICIGEFFEDDEVVFDQLNSNRSEDRNDTSESSNRSEDRNDSSESSVVTNNTSVIICEDNDDSLIIMGDRTVNSATAFSERYMEKIAAEFPCPVCNLFFPEKDINRHAETHFS